MREVWKDVVGYEDLYEVSNFGRVKSLIQCPPRILMPYQNRTDYARLVLTKCGLHKKVLVHRIVYEAFVGSIPKGFQIHHIDGNRWNNKISNLKAVCTSVHSKLTRKDNPHICKGMVEYNRAKAKSILQFDLDGTLIAEYPNAKAASEITGICMRNIQQVVSGELNQNGKVRKQAGGFIWRAKR